MIGQKFCLTFLTPIALERLAENEFVSGKRYTGDLLCAMLEIGYEFWKKNFDLHWSLIQSLLVLITVLKH